MLVKPSAPTILRKDLIKNFEDSSLRGLHFFLEFPLTYFIFIIISSKIFLSKQT